MVDLRRRLRSIRLVSSPRQQASLAAQGAQTAGPAYLASANSEAGASGMPGAKRRRHDPAADGRVRRTDGRFSARPRLKGSGHMRRPGGPLSSIQACIQPLESID